MTERVRQLRTQIQTRGAPAHVGIIMDGNGRWAQARGLPRLDGHRAGSESVRAVTTAARQLGVQVLTLYAFSSQNWLRPPGEVVGLMSLLVEFLAKERPTLGEHDIRLRPLGDLAKLPGSVRAALEETARATERNRSMVLCLALSYGGREELVAAARQLAREAKRGGLDPESIDEKVLADHLWSAGLPELDLCIRTSGELRISNFLPWQMAYAELVATPTLWPDFREEHLLEAILEYHRRERRFGLTPSQLGKDGG